ncbi:hypothetical protein [Gluconacetobacter dulcium]|nr:hypothetical protein [Gluconacetobacter dulcium]MBB2198878.1 hypothetical protein [Gluconacetobacter dulcium]
MMVIAAKEARSARNPVQPFRRPGEGRIWCHVEAAGIGLIIALGLILLLTLHGAA